jgi:RNA-binding motif X-linked protein 2
MNPLTQIKNTQKATASEIRLGLSDSASWHSRFKHSAYVFVGGLDYELTEGDLLAVFAQYGEVVDVHLVRDKASGKSRGFAFLAYEDQRSTVLAVDNLSGARVAGRTVRVEHVDNYRKKKAEVRACVCAAERGGQFAWGCVHATGASLADAAPLWSVYKHKPRRAKDLQLSGMFAAGLGLYADVL